MYFIEYMTCTITIRDVINAYSYGFILYTIELTKESKFCDLPRQAVGHKCPFVLGSLLLDNTLFSLQKNESNKRTK